MMTRHRGVRFLLAASLPALALLVSSTAFGQLCYTNSDEKDPSKGVPVAWDKTEVEYVTYVPSAGTRLPAKADVIKAIDAAFAAYNAIKCSTLKFKNAGEMTTLVTQKPGQIVVYFGKDTTEWTYGGSAYFYTMRWTSAKTGAIDYGVIGMNAATINWAVGAVANKIDIQTAIMRMIPGVVGYYVGKDPKTGTVDIKYNHVDHKVGADEAKGATYNYFDKNDSTCTKPAAPAVCGSTAPTGDGGGSTGDGGGTTGDGGGPPIGDGGTTTGDSGGTTTGDSGGTTTSDGGGGGTLDGGGSTGDGGGTGGGSDDDGCCRVSHARTANIPLLTLFGLALLLGLSRRRWRRKK